MSGGWIDGFYCHFKDCSQQSKIELYLVIVPVIVFVRVFRVSFILAMRPDWDLLLDVVPLFAVAVPAAVVVVVVAADDVVKPEEHSDPFPETGDVARGDQMSWKIKAIVKLSHCHIVVK